jgi:hypothetical protein
MESSAEQTHLILRFNRQVPDGDCSLLLHPLTGGPQQSNEQRHAAFFYDFTGVVGVHTEVSHNAGAVLLHVLVERPQQRDEWRNSALLHNQVPAVRALAQVL